MGSRLCAETASSFAAFEKRLMSRIIISVSQTTWGAWCQVAPALLYLVSRGLMEEFMKKFISKNTIVSMSALGVLMSASPSYALDKMCEAIPAILKAQYQSIMAEFNGDYGYSRDTARNLLKLMVSDSTV